MKTACYVLLSVVSVVQCSSMKTNPLGTVLSLIDELAAKITKDGEVEAKAYAEYTEWCDEASQNTNFNIETAAKEKAKLEATIEELSSDIATAASKIDDLASAIATASSEVKDATLIREKESADFVANEKELVDTLSALTRAIGILEKEMAKNPAAFAQVSSSDMTNTVQAFSAILDAAAVSSGDQKKLATLLQQQQQNANSDEEMGAPAAATYKTHSTNILDVLEDLKEKAEGQLSDLRKAEVNTRHNFNMLTQSLQDQKTADSKHMAEEKADKGAAEENKAGAQNDLEIATKDLVNSKEQLATTQASCLQTAADHEATVAARKEELQVIAQARKILADTSSGAVAQTYSLMQESTSRLAMHSGLAGAEVVEMVRRLAKKQHSSALAQLASRIAAVARYGSSNGEDPFAKIKGLIQDMITKLEREAGSEATEKAYCDEQIAKTEFKKGELEDDIAKATSRIDQSAAKSAQLKEQIKVLEAELAALTKLQAEMDKIRADTHAEYETAKADLELGLSGVRKASAILRDYYGGAAMLQDDTQPSSFMQQPAAPVLHSKSSGAGGSILDILEVCESDFAKNLAKEESEEADAQSEYEKVSQENAVTKESKEQDVKYKSQESASLQATVVEQSGDRATARSELDAVLEFYGKIKERCIAKPEAYEDRKARRDAEIKGLKEALSILENETALVQRKRRVFRGALTAQ